jgi:hypothetical protein
MDGTRHTGVVMYYNFEMDNVKVYFPDATSDYIAPGEICFEPRIEPSVVAYVLRFYAF